MYKRIAMSEANVRRICRGGLIVILLFFGPVACVFFEPCPDVKPYFAIQGLHTQHLRLTGQGQNPWEKPGDSEPVRWGDYFLLASFEKRYHAAGKGGASLYALSCDESGHSGTKLGVDTLYLIALTDYNANYRQGDTLNNILLVNDWTSPPKDSSGFYPLALYFEQNRNTIREEAFGLRLTEPPGTAGAYRFRLVYALRNGDTFEATSADARLYHGSKANIASMVQAYPYN